jgi:hypothetical protein
MEATHDPNELFLIGFYEPVYYKKLAPRATVKSAAGAFIH